MAGPTQLSVRASPAAWYALGVLLLANFFNYLDRMVLGLLIEPIRADLHLSDSQIGLLIGATFALVYTVATLPMGRVVDQFDRRRVIALGCFVWSTAAVAIGFARSFPQLLVARMGVAVGESALVPAATSLIADLFPKSVLGRALAIYGVGGVAGAGGALIVGGSVLDLVSRLPEIAVPVYGVLKGWQLTLILTGLPSFLIVFLVFTFREPARTGVLEGAKVSIAATARHIRGHFGYFGLHFVGFALLQMFAYAITSWLPAFLMRVHGMSASSVGLIYGSMWLSLGVGGAVLGGALADRFLSRDREIGVIWVIIGACAVLWPMSAIYPMVASPSAALILIAVMTLVTGIPVGLSHLLLQLVTPNQMRGQVVAIATFVVNLIGFGLGPTGVGLISDHLGSGPEGLRKSLALIGLTCSPLAGLLFLFALKPFARVRALARTWS